MWRICENIPLDIKKESFCKTLDKLYQRSKAESKADFIHLTALLAEQSSPSGKHDSESVTNDEK